MTNVHLTGGVAPVNGAELYYEMAGAGPAVVFVHAGIADRTMWDEQLDTFAQHFLVLRYDMRGYGQSPPVAGDFSHHADLYALLQYLALDRAALMGCSKGGGAILDLALVHPEAVTALIPVCAAPSGIEFTGDPPRQWDELVAAFKAGDFERASELEVQIWVDGARRTPDQVDARIRDRIRAANMVVLRNDSKELGSEARLDPPAARRLGEIKAPTLVVVGDLDDPNIVNAAAMLDAQIPGARKVVIGGTAHLPNMERPDELNRHVLEFLRGVLGA